MKKNLMKLLILLPFLTLASCGGETVDPGPGPDPEPEEQVEVRFYADCTQTDYIKILVDSEAKLTKPDDPTSNDPAFDVFLGWSTKVLVSSAEDYWDFAVDSAPNVLFQSVLELWGQWDSSVINPDDPDPDPDPDPEVDENAWYIVGEGSFLTGPKTTWEPTSGFKMVENPDYTGVGAEYKAIGIAFSANDIWKLCKGDKTVWISNGWETNAGALLSGEMELVSDGYGGNNVKVTAAGKYDIYYKVYSDTSFSCYISESY